MKLSVCMIVKNEEIVLARILSQASRFADEIIVVDTGSTDNTKDIALQFTDKVYDFEWRDDFAAARNFSYDKASNDFVMWLDADDFITETNIQKILLLKKRNLDLDVFMFKYQAAFDQTGKPTFEYYRERITKNSPRLRWAGFVHEAIAIQGKIEYFDIAIEHRKIEHARDVSRNLKIYHKHLENGEKLDTRGLFYYSRELYFNNKIDEAILSFKKFLNEKSAYLPNRIDALLMLSRCYNTKNNLEDAKNALIDSFKLASPNAELCCALADIYAKESNLDASIFWYKAAINCEINLKGGGFVQRDFYDFVPYLQLSCLYFKINDKEQFKFYHEKAKSIKPEHPSIIYNEQFV